jgi:O-acetyl-ADP-ribose deacetylase (regulator of RNase III)
MKIYFLDREMSKLSWMKRYFKDADVEFACDDLEDFLNKTQVECIVSPANAFGLMDGGYDYYITHYFGNQLQERVQNYIIKNFYGEQPLGTSFIISANDKGQKLIHTPTMQVPKEIKDPFIVYQCMRSTLICAKKNKVKSIVIPMFGGGIGGVHPQIIAEMMRKAYDQVQNKPKTIDWEYAFSVEAN